MQRIGIMSEQIEMIIQSVSKKKILYQYDQLTSKEIKKETNAIFLRDFKDNPLTKFLYYDQMESPSESEDSEEGKGAKKVKKTLVQKRMLKGVKSFVHKQLEMNEDNMDFEKLIQNLNNKLHKLQKKIQHYQFKKKIIIPNQEGLQSVNYGQQLIIPIDCIQVEAYGPPQINVHPLKLLMLQNQGGQAFQLLLQSLKGISNFFDLNHIKEYVTTDEFNKINLRNNLHTEKETQYENPDQKNFVQFEILKDQLLNVAYDLRNQTKDDKFMDSFQHSLEVSNSEEDFIIELNKNVQSRISNIKNKIKSKISEFKIIGGQNAVVESNLNQVYTMFQGKRQPNSSDFDNSPQSSHRIGTSALLPQEHEEKHEQKPILNQRTSVLVQKLQGQDQKMQGQDQKNQMFDQCTQTIDQKRNFEQQAPLKLKRQDDLLRESKQHVEQRKQSIAIKLPKIDKYSIKSITRGNQTDINQKYFDQNQELKFVILDLQSQILILKSKNQKSSESTTHFGSYIDQSQNPKVSQIKISDYSAQSPTHIKVPFAQKQSDVFDLIRDNVTVKMNLNSIKTPTPTQLIKNQHDFNLIQYQTTRTLIKNQRYNQFMLLGGFKTQVKNLFACLQTTIVNDQKLFNSINLLNKKSYSVNEKEKKEFMISHFNKKNYQIQQILKDQEQKKQQNIEITKHYTDNFETEFFRPKTSLIHNHSIRSQSNLLANKSSNLSSMKQLNYRSIESKKFFELTRDVQTAENNKRKQNPIDRSFMFNSIRLDDKKHEHQLLIKYQKSFTNFKF